VTLPSPGPVSSKVFFARLGVLILSAALVYLVWRIVAPLWQPLLWAVLIGALVAPLNVRLSDRLGGRRQLAASLTLLGVLLLFLLPMLALADRLSAAARQPLRHELFEPPQFADRRRILVQLDQALEYAGAGTGIPHNANRSAIVFICHHWMLPDAGGMTATQLTSVE